MEITTKEELITYLKSIEDKISTLEANLSTKEEETDVVDDPTEETKETEIESTDEISQLFDL
jgi:hypothetical protein